MHKNQYSDKDAIVLLGGTSIKSYIAKLKNINKSKFVIFAESKCISKKLLDNGINPDYFICPFSIKLKDNYFQNFIFRSLLKGINIKKFIEKKYYDEVDYIKNNFDFFYKKWRPERGLHKKFIFKKNLFLKKSPYDNLKFFPEAKIIIDQNDFDQNFEKFEYDNEKIIIQFNNNTQYFDQNKYYNVQKINGVLNFEDTSFLNSQSICHFPLMKYLGFKKVFFLGMDMNFFGSFEYDFREIFKSKLHLSVFIFLVRKTLNGNFKMNYPIYLRPKDEFLNLDQIIPEKNNFFRVVTKDKMCKVPKLNIIHAEEFSNILI